MSKRGPLRYREHRMESRRQSLHCALQQFPVSFIKNQEFMDQYLLELHGGSGKLCVKGC